ncbi:MAG: hypothetical protein AAGU23_00825 [Bacillota bacterium]
MMNTYLYLSTIFIIMVSGIGFFAFLFPMNLWTTGGWPFICLWAQGWVLLIHLSVFYCGAGPTDPVNHKRMMSWNIKFSNPGGLLNFLVLEGAKPVFGIHIIWSCATQGG